MKLYNVIPEETNNFMNKLLKEGIFDNFQVRDIDIKTFTQFKIDCVKYKIENSQDEENPKIQFLTWVEIKDYVINIIKGKKLPQHIKLIFSIPDDSLEKIHENAGSLFINLTYENNQVTILTGNSQKKFELNKNVDDAWDKFVINFFKKNGLNIREA